MEKNKFRLIVRGYDGSNAKFESNVAHDAKATAGRLIHIDSVKSVCVVGVSGVCYFYISKENPESNVTNIPSEIAEFMESIFNQRGLTKSQIAFIFNK